MSLPAEAATLLRRARLSAHLATSVDDRPHVAPVWYVLDGAGGVDDGRVAPGRSGEGEHVYVRTGGVKLRNLRRNPRVALSVERATEESGVEWAVTMRGTARLVDEGPVVTRVRRLLDEKYSFDEGESEGRDGAATDGGGTDGGSDDDPNDDPDADWCLVEIRVASAVVQRY